MNKRVGQKAFLWEVSVGGGLVWTITAWLYAFSNQVVWRPGVGQAEDFIHNSALGKVTLSGDTAGGPEQPHVPVHDSQIQTLPTNPTCQAGKAFMVVGLETLATRNRAF